MNEKLSINGGKPIRKEFLPYGHQNITQEDIKAVVKVLKSDFITQGPKIKEFEEIVTKYCNAKYAVAFSSGTAALHGAVYAAGVKKNKEVITSPNTFVASANCVLYQGGVVKFADIKSDTYNIDSEQIKKQITKGTKAIIPVDFAGQPCDIDEINQIAKENNLITIEDASHAIGAKYKNKKIGILSDMTVFSFHPVKHLTTGEGGMVLTDNEEYFEKLKLFRTHGITKNPGKLEKNDGGWYYEMQDLGYNYRLSDIHCALGISQMEKLQKNIDKRREIVKIYNNSLKKYDEIITPFEKKDVKTSYHLYVVNFILEKLKIDRKKIYDTFKANNIGVQVHYIPVHLQPYYIKKFGYKKGDYPISERFYQRALSLPLFPTMTKEDIDNVITVVDEVISKNRG